MDIDGMSINPTKTTWRQSFELKNKTNNNLLENFENFENIHQNCWKATIIVLDQIWWRIWIWWTWDLGYGVDQV